MPTPAPRKPFVGGNWKMNTDQRGAGDLARGVADGIADLSGVDVAVFPPFPYLLTVGSVLRERSSTIKLGAQDFYHQPDGAFTGEVSVSMLRDCGVQVVLVGHSERRHVIGEPDGLINEKTLAALEAGLEVVLCVGEKIEQREAGKTDAVNLGQTALGLAGVSPEQMARVTIAYEPVWAIGTGKTATPDDAQAAHARIRSFVRFGLYDQHVAEALRIQYGGSVKPSNAAELFALPDVDGGLIGGASLKPADFVQIARAAAR